MELLWKWLNLFIGLLLAGLCNGFPTNLEETNIERAQLLTGLVAILLTICSIVLLAGCLCCHRRNGFKEFRNNPVVASSTLNLDHGHVNPIANGEFTIFTPLSPPHYNNNVFLANEQVITRTSDDYVYGDVNVSAWFNGPEKDFPRIKLKYIKELGKGWFGKVVEGAAQDLDPNRPWTPVVVRILDAASNARERVLFLNDASIYLAPSHPNLLALRGKCVSAAPLLLLQESCTGGDLKARLRKNGSEDKALLWCCQLTSALRHLHERGIVHPDLAARNCLLTDALVLKLGDYGLGPSEYPEDYYKGGEPLIPVRWRSPESLDCTPTTIRPKKVTAESNVWSLGVTMWEIFENGAQPYGDLNDDEVVTKVFGPQGLRLERPSKPLLYTDYIFRLIKMCWNNTDSRPKVGQIDMMLTDLLQVHKNTQSSIPNATDDFDSRWESFKPNTIVKTDNYAVAIDIDDDDEGTISKPMSPSLNNLHGSLDNLQSNEPMTTWIENVATETRDPSYVKGLLEAINDLDTTLDLENVSTGSEQSFRPDLNVKTSLDFLLGPSQTRPTEKLPDSPNYQNDSLTDSMIFKQQLSSESETEEENWRKKVERGAYSEKVRLKSRSVADLMVLTHVDYSESETETPLPSLDYRTNRSCKKSNLETASLNFSSEGNLLNIEDTFQEELKKLQVERRDSLLFVPDRSENNSNLSLLQEFNSPSEIKPLNQIYNIFNVTIDKYSPMMVSGSKLSEIINIGEDTRSFSRQDSENKSDLGYATLHNSERNSDFGSVDGEHLLEDHNVSIKNEIEKRLKNCVLFNNINGDSVKSVELLEEAGSNEALKTEETHKIVENCEEVDVFETDDVEIESCQNSLILNVNSDTVDCKKNLPDIIASLDQDQNQGSVDLLESNILPSGIVKNNTNAMYKSNEIEKTRDFLSQEVIVNSDDQNEDIYFPKAENTCEDDISISETICSSAHNIESNENDPQNENIDINNQLTKYIDVCENSISNINNESQPVPDLCSQDIEYVKSSSNVEEHLDREENKSNLLASSKEQIFTENLVSEIKEHFVEGPQIFKRSIYSSENTSNSKLMDLDANNSIFDYDLEYDSCSQTSESDEDLVDLMEDNECYNDNSEDETQSLDGMLTSAENMECTSEAINETVINNFEDIHEENDSDIHYTTTYSSLDNKDGEKNKFDIESFLEEERKIASTYPQVDGSYSQTINEFVVTNSQNENVSVDLNVSKQTICFPESNEGNKNVLDFKLAEESRLKGVVDQPSMKSEDQKLKVAFDLSDNQEETKPNSLTHTTVFTSTPFGKKQEISLPSENTYTSLNLFGITPEDDGTMEFSSNFAPILKSPENHNKLNYSLETWDNFLGKSFDTSRGSNENLFNSFTSEPQSILFIEEEKRGNTLEENEIQQSTFVKENGDNGTFIKDLTIEKPDGNTTFVKDDTFVMANGTFVKDGTFVMDEPKNNTFVKDEGSVTAENGVKENSSSETEGKGSWSGGGWFLHPQSQNDELTGDIDQTSAKTKGSYVGFGMDEEIMTAIRNELLEKLPHAQGVSQEKVKEDGEEWNQNERNEVFLRYNVYNTPLSPIPEESFEDDDNLSSGENTPKLEVSDSDWSDRCEPNDLPQFSSQTNESSTRINHHEQTQSQSSCCSNDTLFNLEDFACNNDKEHGSHDKDCQDVLRNDVFESEDSTLEKEDLEHGPTSSSAKGVENILLANPLEITNNESKLDSLSKDSTESTLQAEPFDTLRCKLEDSEVSISEFLDSERNHTSSVDLTCNKQVAPLPSPEDIPWKSLPASLLTFDTISNKSLLPDEHNVPESLDNSLKDNVPFCMESLQPFCQVNSSNPSNVDSPVIEKNHESTTHLNNTVLYENLAECQKKVNESTVYENVVNADEISAVPAIDGLAIYENIDNSVDNINEADYVEIANFENAKHKSDFALDCKHSPDYVNNVEHNDALIMENTSGSDTDLYGVLTDIRFNGPIDSQLMSTSFSESNDVEEQDWDSGSDTRSSSSSSGEFIWKEGEHEESLKAHRAAPHDALDDMKPMEEITKEASDSDISTSSSDDEGETPEFVPSAWDKYATPTKSALRSPEKTLERCEEKKSKGVWFKKQKYHCVYEYPKEPDSPVLQSRDLWQPQHDFTAFSDWEFDAETYLPPPTGDSDIDINPSTLTFKSKINNSRRSLYYLTSLNDDPGEGKSNSSKAVDDLIISDSSRSFDPNTVLCSQFFPGSSNWIEYSTDSGLEDSTPGSISDSTEFPENYAKCSREVLPLRKIAAAVVKKTKENELNKGSKDVLGGLRHTRNKLKLDLPPSPSAFTSSRSFTMEPESEPVVLREKPTFSTFGKSRFLVQQVDTTTTESNANTSKNVCFDVLPYKPLNIIPVSSESSVQNSNDTLKKDFEEYVGFANKKDVIAKGETGLLDSADEDSGIESSTLERKVINKADEPN